LKVSKQKSKQILKLYKNSILADSEKCKKHWKNVRDRYVKVMHQRDKHFFNGGNELNAPQVQKEISMILTKFSNTFTIFQYIYFDKLNFMREFSIQKDPYVEPSNNVTIPTTLSPDHLIYEEFKDSSGETNYFDYTDQFLERIKEFPVLFDQHAEMRKYRSKEAWKQLADELGGKFTVGKLRHYWMTLIKKYKMYLETTHSHCEPIENEALYESLSFTNVGIQVKREPNLNNDIRFILQSEDLDSSRELFDDLNDEEHLLCEEVEDVLDASAGEEVTSQTLHDDETVQAIESIEEVLEPEPKRLKVDTPTLNHSEIRLSFPMTQVLPENSFPTPPLAQLQNSHPVPSPSSTANDEFDYFGKKVALQLRNIAHKSRNVALKGEIKVLQLLMELEESLDN
jgi:Alcohol dehydrogenase transcription factor Myb/SANT-like